MTESRPTGHPETAGELIEKAAAIVKAAETAWRRDTVGVPSERHEMVARALADAGLLADPEHAAELNAGWVAYKHRKIEERRKLTAERDQRTEERDAFMDELAQMRKNWDAARAANMTALETIHQVEAERDLLQARIDKAIDEIAQWWGRGQPGGRTLMAVNSILRGDIPTEPAPDLERADDAPSQDGTSLLSSPSPSSGEVDPSGRWVGDRFEPFPDGAA